MNTIVIPEEAPTMQPPPPFTPNTEGYIPYAQVRRAARLAGHYLEERFYQYGQIRRAMCFHCGAWVQIHPDNAVTGLQQCRGQRPAHLPAGVGREGVGRL